MAVTITEILGTDSISGSRLTINANFLLLENAYNDLENTFNINVLTGSMDVSTAPSGQIKAKSFVSNSLVMPASGSPNIQIYGTGASAGSVIASNTIAGATGFFSNTLLTNSFSASGPVTFNATGTFNKTVNLNSSIIIGASGNMINNNRKAAVGATTPFPAAPGAGVTGSYNNPYVPTLEENVIYINSAYSEGGYTGFFMRIPTGGSSNIPAGFTITLIDVATTGGIIATGETGSSPYYTGFSINGGSFPPNGITTPGNPYKSSLTLMWEPRIDGNSQIHPGSWVVISSTPGFGF